MTHTYICFKEDVSDCRALPVLGGVFLFSNIPALLMQIRASSMAPYVLVTSTPQPIHPPHSLDANSLFTISATLTQRLPMNPDAPSP